MDELEFHPMSDKRVIEGKLHICHGISGFRGNTKVLEIPDLSTDAAAVEEFAAVCTRLGVSENHIWDVVEDFLP